MDKIPPWNQGYGQGYFQQRPFNMVQPPGQAQPQAPPHMQGQQGTPSQATQGDYSMQMEYLNSLSRAERFEARRLELQSNFSFDGFQVVRREFISHQFDPAMTIRGTSVTFNNACISRLENATYINFLINASTMLLVIRSVSEGAKHAVRWCLVKGDKRKSRQITCKPFTEKLYALMNWDPVYRYKMQGWKIKYMGEDLYVFDLREVECFIPQHRDPKTGKAPRAKAVFPEGWNDSFGVSVEENEAAMNVDINEGFSEVDATQGPTDPEDPGKEVTT